MLVYRLEIMSNFASTDAKEAKIGLNKLEET